LAPIETQARDADATVSQFGGSHARQLGVAQLLGVAWQPGAAGEPTVTLQLNVARQYEFFYLNHLVTFFG
jgi:hypothetical protein